MKDKNGKEVRPTVVIGSELLAAPGLEILERAGCNVIFSRDGTAKSLLETVKRQPVNAMLLRNVACPAEVIHAAVDLKAISRHGVGYEQVDVEAASALGIPVLIAQGANAQSVTELAIGFMLAIARDLVNHTNIIHGNGWKRAAAGVQVNGKTLGIVGLGTIGSKVARVGLALGMNVVAYDIEPRALDGVRMTGSLDELLAQAQVVSLHTPLTPLTRGMMGAAQFARLPKGAIVVNTSRGEVVDEKALHDALASGHLGGAGFDVQHVEKPQPENPLRKLPNVVMTPHVGGHTDAALDAVAELAAQNIIDVLEGKPLRKEMCVNFDRLVRTPSRPY
jgi:D-3-phosphoglycerate dehydrogenase / 2-oxoglutarate reductase